MSTGLFNPLATWVDSIRPASEKIGRLCAMFAVGMFERLDTIAENTGDRVTRRRYVDVLNFAGAATREREVPVGQQYSLALLAVSAAGTVTIRSGSRLMYVKAFAGPDTVGPDAFISAGPGTPFTVQVSAAMEVTLHIDITQRDDAAPGVAGDTHPAGIRTNAMELAISQHFPGVLDVDGDPYNIHRNDARGSVYGAGDTQPAGEAE